VCFTVHAAGEVWLTILSNRKQANEVPYKARGVEMRGKNVFSDSASMLIRLQLLVR
jgi:hypothetical protein